MRIKLLIALAGFFESLPLSAMWVGMLKVLSGKKPGENPAVLFLVADPGVWRLDSTITLLKARGIKFEIGMASFGHRMQNRVLAERFISRMSNEGYSVRPLRWYSLRDSMWLHSFKVVIFNHPYKFLNAPVSIPSLRNSVTIYMPYTLGILNEWTHLHFGEKSLRNATFILAESEFVRRAISESAPWAVGKLLTVGFPTINGTSSSTTLASVISQTAHNVLFAPHWTSFTSKSALQASQMRSLINSLNDESGGGKNFKIRLRPHPRMLEHIRGSSSAGVLSTGLESMESSEGVNPVSDFVWSSILITNSSSFLAEYTFTGKPLIYWAPGSSILPKLNQFGRDCLVHQYVAHSVSDLKDLLSDLLLGVDSKRKSREAYREEFIKQYSGGTFEQELVKLMSSIINTKDGK